MRDRWPVFGVALVCVACGDRERPAVEETALSDCQPRCERKIALCELLVGDATTYCEEFCDQDLSRAQLECYAAATCEALWYASHGCAYGLDCPKRTCTCDGEVHTGHFEKGGVCAPSCVEVCAEFRALGA